MNARFDGEPCSGRLAGEVALITGSTRGIGRSIAMRFACEGAAVVVTGRDERKGAAVTSQIRDAHGRATFVRADVSSEADVRGAISHAIESFGKLTIVVNNAAPMHLMVGAGAVDGELSVLTDDAWAGVFDTMVRAVLWTSRHAMPELVRAGGGSIVNVSSIAGLLAMPSSAAYSAAKSAIHAMTRSVALEGAPVGVRCNAMAVGFVAPDDAAPITRGARRDAPALPRGSPTDVASAALFLASREAKFITGAVIPVDGGATCAALAVSQPRPPAGEVDDA